MAPVWKSPPLLKLHLAHISTPPWLFKNRSTFGTKISTIKTRSPRPWSALDNSNNLMPQAVYKSHPQHHLSPLLRLLLPGSQFAEHRLTHCPMSGAESNPLVFLYDRLCTSSEAMYQLNACWFSTAPVISSQSHTLVRQEKGINFLRGGLYMKERKLESNKTAHTKSIY